jgi:hypothetical protein
MFNFISYSDNQRKQYINTEHTYRRFLEQYQHYHIHYKYSIFWEKNILVKKRSRNNKKEYIGKRSEETERIYEQFIKGKKESRERLRMAEEELKIQEKFNKFYQLNRTPKALIKIFQKLNKLNMDDKIIVIGTNSLYAYESYCAVFIEEKHLATFDIDLLSRKDKKISFLFKEQLPDIKATQFLKEIDKSFEENPKVPYRFENREGVVVEIINPTRKGISKKDSFMDIIGLDMEGMQWLESTKIFKSLIIGENGQVAYLKTINPLDFAIYKLWLSSKTDREPIKRERDLKQTKLVTKLMKEYMLDIDISSEVLQIKHFSKKLIKTYRGFLEER